MDHSPLRLGVPVKILGNPDLKSNDARRATSKPHLKVSLGYLEAIPTECLAGGCGSSCGSCAVTRSSRSWSVTPKGERLIASKV